MVQVCARGCVFANFEFGSSSVVFYSVMPGCVFICRSDTAGIRK
uniref:Uncharacterized protein n=1 Tax=Anguilla anguilla TaxID=7936 RepID=A0A0E9W6V4_ANGAN